MEGFSWDAPYLNTFDYSWEQHPSFLTNIQDDDTYTSFSPPYQDWNDTSMNTFDQSWEGIFDYSCNFQGSDLHYESTSFVPNYPPENCFEQPEPSHSFETFSPSLIEMFTTFLENFTSSFETLNTKMVQLVDELKNQSQGPLPSGNEKLKCVGKDESDVKKEFEIFEANFEHPSIGDNNAFTVVTQQTAWRIGMIKGSGYFHGSCSLGGDGVARHFGMVEVAIILKPLYVLKMHMWGGEPHPT